MKDKGFGLCDFNPIKHSGEGRKCDRVLHEQVFYVITNMFHVLTLHEKTHNFKEGVHITQLITHTKSIVLHAQYEFQVQ